MVSFSCPICLAGGKQVEVARIAPTPGENNELVWTALCPQCGAKGSFSPAKQHRCPHCKKSFSEVVPYRAPVPGV